MAISTGIIFCTLLLGSLALPVPEDELDLSIFFDTTPDFSFEGRIVGGSVAAEGSHPWMVAFTSGGMFRTMHCGGSVISTRTVLTAAHCVAPALKGQIRNIRAIVGTNHFPTGGVAHTISAAAYHPQYLQNSIKNDIGVLHTTDRIEFNELVAPISISWEHVDGGVATRLAGFGRTSANGAVSQQLLEINLSTIDGQQCVTAVREAAIALNTLAPPVDPEVEICTFHSRGIGACRGDSGGALVQIDNGHQIGVVSWGFPCAIGAPDMFVRISSFRTWVTQNSRQ